VRRLGAALLLAGCMVGPDYVRPDVPMPDQWTQELGGGLFEGEAQLADWWTVLDDPVLDGLIERAAAGSLDLKIAVARIKEARARVGVVAGRKYPTVNASGAAGGARPSAEAPIAPPVVDSTTLYEVGLDAAWEIDLWGRVRRSVEAARGDLAASVEAERDVKVSLFAEIAVTYVSLRTLQERVAIARSNLDSQKESLRIAESRFRNGLSPELDVQQATTNLSTTEASLPALEDQIASAINRIAVLLGEHPEAVKDELTATGPVPLPPEKVVVGLPANLLRQRPDVRGAERRLAAQTARIGVATADLYPTFVLAGNIGWQAEDLGNLLTSSARVWEGGLAFNWNLFSAGSVRSNIDVQDARTEEALHVYELTILLAIEEVEDALVSYVQEQQRRDALSRAVDAAKRAADLCRDLYKQGLTDFNNVLDTERTVLSLEDQLADSRGRVSVNLARLYKALGGGWQDPTQDRPAG